MGRKIKNYSKGFTLIELLVVIAVIGILASVVLSSLSESRKKARDARRINDLYQIRVALEAYYSDNGFYPPSQCGYDCSGYFLSTYPGWTTTLQVALAPYISKLPVDPINVGTYPWDNGAYVYSYGLVGNSVYSPQYDLTAKFESSNHPLSCGVKNYRFTWNNALPLCPTYSVDLYEASPQ